MEIVPRRRLGWKSPYELQYGRKQDMKRLQIYVPGVRDLNMECPGGIDTERATEQWIDNKGARDVAIKPGTLSDVSRHLVKDITSLRGRTAQLEPILGWCPTKEMLADIGSKFQKQADYDYMKPRVRGEVRSIYFVDLQEPTANPNHEG